MEINEAASSSQPASSHDAAALPRYPQWPATDDAVDPVPERVRKRQVGNEDETTHVWQIDKKQAKSDRPEWSPYETGAQ